MPICTIQNFSVRIGRPIRQKWILQRHLITAQNVSNYINLYFLSKILIVNIETKFACFHVQRRQQDKSFAAIVK